MQLALRLHCHLSMNTNATYLLTSPLTAALAPVAGSARTTVAAESIAVDAGVQATPDGVGKHHYQAAGNGNAKAGGRRGIPITSPPTSRISDATERPLAGQDTTGVQAMTMTLTQDIGAATTAQRIADAAQRVADLAKQEARVLYRANSPIWARHWCAAVETFLSLSPLSVSSTLEYSLPLRGRDDSDSDYAARLLSWVAEPAQWGKIISADLAAREAKRQHEYVLACRAAQAKWQATVSRKVRAAAGCPRTSYPIETDDTDDAPIICGESWHYQTRGGRRIYHPSAYSRSGWSNMVYVGSTRRIVVGRGWLAAQGLPTEPDAISDM
jgi:hypothetical protein